MRVYPTITTISQKAYFNKIREVAKLGLREVCFFPTMVGFEERKKICKLLVKTSVKYIPLVHLRNDCRPEEIKYFMVKYKTRHFNIHSQNRHPLQYDLAAYKKFIYLENSHQSPVKGEVGRWAGICLDFAHLEDLRLRQKNIFSRYWRLTKKHYIGCAHLSAIKIKPSLNLDDGQLIYDSHYFQNLSEFDYLKRYRKILPVIGAIELENSIAEQLTVKAYLEKILR
jgi:hypothetical protein